MSGERPRTTRCASFAPAARRREMDLLTTAAKTGIADNRGRIYAIISLMSYSWMFAGQGAQVPGAGKGFAEVAAFAIV